MKFLTLILLLFLSIVSFCQETTSLETIRIAPDREFNLKSVEEAIRLAKLDSDNDTLILICNYKSNCMTVSESDLNFLLNYQVYYYRSGCPGFDSVKESFALGYNQIIFQRLEELFGEDWQKEVREDVIGIEAFKAKNAP